MKHSKSNFRYVITAFLLLQICFSINAEGQQIVHSSIPPNIATLWQPIARLDSTKHLNLAIALPLRNQTELTTLVQQIYDPTSPNYRQYLTVEQFTAKFGPPDQDYQSVIAFAREKGLTVTDTYPNRMLVDVSGTVADIEKALHIKMHVYQHPTEARTFYAPDNDPSVDLAIPVLKISGLDNYSIPRPHSRANHIINTEAAKPNAGSGPGNTYWGTDFRAAYVPSVSLTGSGQKLGLLEFDGYTAGDITYYENYENPHLPYVTLTNEKLDQFDGIPVYPDGQRECSLDIEMAISMAPGLSGIVVYEAGPSGNYDDIITRMATDNSCKQLSCSWGIHGDSVASYTDGIFNEMATQGQSFFNASGDNDAFAPASWTNPSNGHTYSSFILFPSEDPNITQVGGTTLSTSGPGGSYQSEVVWNRGYVPPPADNYEGSSGGIGMFYQIPIWQKGIDMSSNQGSTTMINIPDVALTADNVYVRCSLSNGSDWSMVGTSCAAPLWAGFMALANQQNANLGHNTAGFINPLIYLVNKKGYQTSFFHDITAGNGNNEWPGSPTKFSATNGYDLCTGWGTPIGQALINVFAHNSPTVTIYGPTKLNQNQAGTFTATASSGAPPYIYQWWKEENGVPGAGPASLQKVSPDRPAPNNWYMIGSNSPTELSSDITNFSIKCVVTDPTTQNGSDSVTSNIISVIVNGSGMAENTQSQSEAVVRDIPEENSLSQNYPNPFNPSTQIRFALTEPVHVKLIVYDMLGREVARLADENMEAGYHSVTWNATNVSSGIYFYQLSASGFVQVRRMIVMK